MEASSRFQQDAAGGDTVFAISTPPGRSSLALLRLSGPRAISRLAELSGVGGRELAETPGFHGTSVVLDVEGARVSTWVLVYRAPRSYTREDMAEALLPGSEPLLGIVTRALVDSLSRCQVRWARPGEFTLRAFSSGRIDLSQAEAVAGLISSAGEAEARAARRALRGDLGGAVSELSRDILASLARIEAILDFPQEDLPDVSAEATLEVVDSLRGRLSSLRRSTALRVRRGGHLRVVLVGFPNAGKSSLLNAILGRPLALTSHLAGTTRDPVRGVTAREGRQVEWVDVAGVRDVADILGEPPQRYRESPDESREIADIVRRLTCREIQTADLVIWVADAALPLEESLAQFRRIQAPAKLLVLAKSDLLSAGSIERLQGLPERPAVVSAKERLGLDELSRRVLAEAAGAAPTAAAALTAGAAAPGSLDAGSPQFLVSARQESLLLDCDGSLGRAQEAAASSAGLEYVAADLRDALRCLEDLAGKEPREAVLDWIFSRFCIGK